MRYQVLVVVATMDVEAFPEVSSDDDASEAIFLHFGYILQRNTSLSHNVSVDDTLTCGRMKLFVREAGNIAGFRYAVEYVLQNDVLAVVLVLLYLLQSVACAANHIAVVGRWSGVVVTEVYAHQIKLFLQIEMVMNHDSTMVFVG